MHDPIVEPTSFCDDCSCVTHGRMDYEMIDESNPLPLPGELAEAEVTQIQGGYSGNSVFRAELPSRSVCVKRFTTASDADREWNLLVALSEGGVGCVPSPLDRYGQEGEIITMTWLNGEPLDNVALTPIQVDALATSLIAFGSARDARFPSATNQTDRVVLRAHEAREAIARQSPSSAELLSGIDRLLALPDVVDMSSSTVTWLGRGDPNLANALWDGETVKFVDLEHTGYNDRPTELADLAEHLQSHCCQDEVWDRLWNKMKISEDETRRISFARGLTAVWWLGMLMTDDLAKRLNPPSRVNTQTERVLRLLRRLT